MTMVIGFGNPLRGDDGVGPAVAEAIRGARPDVHVYTPQQLLPELAASMAAARVVVFVDAAVPARAMESMGSAPGVRPHPPGTVTCRALTPGPGAVANHACSPAGLLATARDAYGAAPAAWLVTIQAHSFDYGTALSDEVAAAVSPAAALVLSLLTPSGAPVGSAPGV